MASLLLLVALLCCLVHCRLTSASQFEAKLISRLLSGFEKRERPVKYDSDTVDVQFLVYLRQVIDVEEKMQIIHSNLWLSLSWIDYRLTWNPAEFNNISSLIVPIDQVWAPDILLYNSATENFDPTYKVHAKVYNTGTVEWMPPGIFASTCAIEIMWFPFDTQHCKLKFSSWTYDMSRINLTLLSDEADMGSYVPNGEWTLLGCPVKRNEQKYECCPEVYVDATYTIVIARRPLFYLFNLVLPTVLISVIALLTFTLPVESGEKVTLCVTILLSICVFLLLVMEQLPATSDAIPLLGLYFACSTMLLSASVFSTIFVLNLHFRHPGMHTMPSWVSKGINIYLAYILRMKRPSQPSEEPEVAPLDENGQQQHSPLVRIGSGGVNEPFMSQQQQQGASGAAMSGASYASSLTDSGAQVDPAQARIGDILRELRTITRKMSRTDAEQDVCEEWKFAAMVVDRLCFWIFSALALALTLVTLFGAPRPDPSRHEGNVAL